jgi:acetyl/propionyl-CoA carboxylase alpha subunit
LRNVVSLLNKTLSYSAEAVKNSISATNFSQTAIDSYLANFENALANSKDSAANYMLTLQSMSEAKTAMEAKIDTAENLVLTSSGKLDIARTSLQKTVLQGELSIDAAREKILALEFDVQTLETKRTTALALSQSQVNISQAALKDKKQVDGRDLEPLYMAILQAQKTYDEAKKKKSDSELVAPMNGKIAKINGKI